MSLALEPSAAARVSSPERSRIRGLVGRMFWPITVAARGVWTVSATVGTLAALGAVPVANLFVFGCLVDMQGTVARSGSIREGLARLAWTRRLATVAVGVAVSLLPLMLLASRAATAELYLGPSAVAEYRGPLVALQAFLLVHLTLAVWRGGSAWHFLRPVDNLRWLLARGRGGRFDDAAADWRAYLAMLEVLPRLWLGVRALVGAFGWIVVPTAIFARAGSIDEVGYALVGGLLLAVVLGWTLALQSRFALTRDFRVFLDLRGARRNLGRAPIAWAVAIVAACVGTVPVWVPAVVELDPMLYWLPLSIWVLLAIPTRLLLAWAVRRGEAGRAYPAPPKPWRLAWRAVGVAACGAIAGLMIFLPGLSAAGRAKLFDHAALWLPLVN